MNGRRFPIDRVNPRNVAPSRHTIFVRGLPGSTNVDTVKDYFSDETKSKCSIDFFSLSEDKIRFSVAVRFKSHELARSMLVKYNGKNFMGHPVEVSWFKDLKKARARINEEHRNGRFRGFRGGGRGHFRGSYDGRGRNFQQRSFLENDTRHVRRSSCSSGGERFPRGVSRDTGRRMHSRSPSRSSHSTSISGSRSGSRSSKRRRTEQNMESVLVPGQDRNRSRLSGSHKVRKNSTSSSSSRSSSYDSCRRNKTSQDRNPSKKTGFRNRGGYFNDIKSISPQVADSVPPKDSFDKYKESSVDQSISFANAPAPSIGDEDTSGLLSGLILLNRKPPAPTQLTAVSRKRRSATHSQSPISSNSSSSNVSSPLRRHQQRKSSKRHESPSRDNEVPPMSPPSLQQSAPSAFVPNSDVERHWKDQPQRSSPSAKDADLDSGRRGLRPSGGLDRWRPVDYPEEKPRYHKNMANQGATNGTGPISAADAISEEDDETNDAEDIKNINVRSSIRGCCDESPLATGSSGRHQKTPEKDPITRFTAPIDPVKVARDRKLRIQERKKTIEEEYKRDCETFATVVRTLISKDNELESRLLPLLKEILHERGQKCVEELRASMVHDEDAEVPVEGKTV